MDMRGCTATPRRPSGHLQKQNGYLAFWHHREMAIEPCSSALTRFHSDLVDRERKNSPLDVIVNPGTPVGRRLKLGSCTGSSLKMIRVAPSEERPFESTVSDYLSLARCPRNGRTRLRNPRATISKVLDRVIRLQRDSPTVYELILDAAKRARLHVITNAPLRNYIERNAGEALSERPIVCLIYKMLEKPCARVYALHTCAFSRVTQR